MQRFFAYSTETESCATREKSQVTNMRNVITSRQTKPLVNVTVYLCGESPRIKKKINI